MRYSILLLLICGQLNAGETIYLTPQRDVVSAIPVIQSIPDAAQPTPHLQVRIGLWGILRLTESDRFVDFGCGDGRVAIAAGFGIKSQCYGIEIDPDRARQAKATVARLELPNVTIIEGDATKVDVPANVGFAYLYPDVLYELIPNILKLERFASYKHKVPGLPMKQLGEFWYWDRSMLKVPETGEWQGVEYEHVLCNDPNCPMCYGPEGIALQIQQKKQHNAKIEEFLKSVRGEQESKVEQSKSETQTYTDETYKVECTRRYCIYETWRTFSDGSQVMLKRWRVNN